MTSPVGGDFVSGSALNAERFRCSMILSMTTLTWDKEKEVTNLELLTRCERIARALTSKTVGDEEDYQILLNTLYLGSVGGVELPSEPADGA